MSSLCSKLIHLGRKLLLVSVFFLSVFLLSGTGAANAADVSFYSQTNPSNYFCCVSHPEGSYFFQRFTANHNNISKIVFNSFSSVNSGAWIEVRDYLTGIIVYTSQSSKRTWSGGSEQTYNIGPVTTYTGREYEVRFYNVDQLSFNASTSSPLTTFGHSSGYTSTAITFSGSLYYSNSAYDFSVIAQYFDVNSRDLILSGHCVTAGSGIYQMSMYATSYPDPNGPWHGGLVTCSDGVWAATYHGVGMTGTSTVYIDDSFYHPTSSPNVISVDQDFSQVISSDPWAVVQTTYTPSSTALRAHDLACSADEWNATGTVWLLGGSFTSLKCNAYAGALAIGFSFSDMSSATFKGSAAAAGNIFPFNFVTGVKSSWDLSASSDLPSDAQVFQLASSSGNIQMPVPPALAGGSTTTKMTLWGPGIFGQSSLVTQIMAGIHLITTLVTYGLFAWWLYLTGQEMYHEWIT